VQEEVTCESKNEAPEVQTEPEVHEDATAETVEQGSSVVEEVVPAKDTPSTTIIVKSLEAIEAATSKTAVEMRELHKLYHNEFSGRLKKMQGELDGYHEVEKGRVYDGILSELAMLYSDNECLVETLDNKQLKYMFMDLLQLMESNGVSVQKSKPDDKRNARHCQVIEQITTDNQEFHDTVEKSMNTGFYIENRTLVKERIHVRVFKG